MRNPGKSKSRSPGVAALMESVAELQKFVDRGMTTEDIKRHYRRYHPDRIRTVSIPGPGKHSPASVRKLRAALGMSQRVFAELIGVSGILVQSWERGVRDPSPLARRLLDTISRDPAGWLAGLRSKGRSRRAG
jgi:DNA-binding transcriptional regulator YiaG